MESTGVFSTSRNIDYWILILCLFLLAAVGYGFQIARFVLLDLVACYFLCKNIREVRNFKILIPLARFVDTGDKSSNRISNNAYRT